MSANDNTLLVRRYMEEIVNTGEVERIGDFISPDYVEVHANERYPVGIDGAGEHVFGVRRTFPDLKLTIEIRTAEGE